MGREPCLQVHECVKLTIRGKVWGIIMGTNVVFESSDHMHAAAECLYVIL